MNFFVPQLSEFNTDEQNRKARDIRMANFRNLMKEQFHLTYFGKVEYWATEQMSSLERRSMYQILVDQKKEEKKAHEEAVKSAKDNAKSKRGRRR